MEKNVTGRSTKLGLAVVVSLLLTLLFSINVFALDTPTKVTGIKQTKASESSAAIAWDAQIYQNCYYQVDLSLDGKNWAVSDEKCYSAECSFYGLSAGKTYYARVRAYTYSYDEGTKYAPAYSDTFKMITTPEAISSQRSSVKEVKCTTTSVSVSWPRVAGATSYRVQIQGGKYANYTHVLTTAATSATIKSLAPAGAYYLHVIPVRSSGTFTTASTYGYLYNSDYVKTSPSKVGGIKFTSYASLKEMGVEWTKINNVDGYQYQVYNAATNKVVAAKNTTSTYDFVKKISAKQFYKVRVRAYVLVGGKKYYGAWSSVKYFGQQVDFDTKRKSSKKLYINWDAMKGATSYTIYASNTSKKGFKKALTTKKTSVTVTKLGKIKLKKGKTVHLYIVANGKFGKTKVKSEARYTYSCTMY